MNKKKEIRDAWKNWLIFFVPLFLVHMIATHFLGFWIAFLLALIFLGATLLHQRYGKKRTWKSILWGVYASNEADKQ